MTVICNPFGRYLIILVALVTGACSTQHVTYVPDGRRGYVVTCGGVMNSYAKCLTQAGLACGSSGYQIVEGGIYDRRLLIACKNP